MAEHSRQPTPVVPPQELSGEDAARELAGAGIRFGSGLSNTTGRAGWYQSYLHGGGEDIFASSVGVRLMHYTFSHLSVATDANGRRLVPRGTTLQTYGSTDKCSPRTSTNDAIGVLVRDIDVTFSDQEITMVRAGSLNETHLWDDGTYGSVDATHVKDALPQIEFIGFDY